MTISDPGLLTLKEAASDLRVSLSTLRRLRRKKRIKFVRMGHRTVFVRRSELLRFITNAEK